MLYLGIDQHARQITISLRDEQGDVLLRVPPCVTAHDDSIARLVPGE
jgi:hypothetical protein